MTEKIYYKDAYIKEFESRVVSCNRLGDKYELVLSSTAFFPEEGGQSSDKGSIGETAVIDAYEKEGTVYHIVKDYIDVGTNVYCRLDFEERFRKMQLHTAEHILCGLIHNSFGYENVGFHLGDDFVTFDVDGVLDEQQLKNIELEANKVVFSNLSVSTFFPSCNELNALNYRSKLDLTENVRIVKIGEVDMCACCAPHVALTGEIGLIKILDFMKHRGGTRIFMQAGYGALYDYNQKQSNIKEISAMLSTPQSESAATLRKYISDTEQIKHINKALGAKIARLYSETVDTEMDNNVILTDDITMEDMREIINLIKPQIKGVLVVLSGEENNYKYVIGSNGKDLGLICKDINKALSGRGGGRGEMVQGTFNCTLQAIKDFFENFK